VDAPPAPCRVIRVIIIIPSTGRRRDRVETPGAESIRVPQLDRVSQNSLNRRVVDDGRWRLDHPELLR
jgi:hypothetical protein